MLEAAWPEMIMKVKECHYTNLKIDRYFVSHAYPTPVSRSVLTIDSDSAPKYKVSALD